MSAFANWTATDVLLHNSRVAGRQVEVEPSKPSDDLEAGLHDYILDYAHAHGWLAVHSRMDRPTTVEEGLPDFLIAGPKDTVGLLVVEAKRPGKKCRPKQRALLAAFAVLGYPTAIVHTRAEFDHFIATRL